MKRIMLFVWLIVIIVGLLCSISGCAGYKIMERKEKNIRLDKYSLLLLKIATASDNQNQEAALIKLLEIRNLDTGKGYYVELAERDCMADMYDVRHYYKALYLKPGRYQLVRLYGIQPNPMRMFEPDIIVDCQVPYSIQGNSIVYCGSVLLGTGIVDQSAIGFNKRVARSDSLSTVKPLAPKYFSGKYFIDFLDNRQDEVANFRAVYPVLQNAEITYAINPKRR